MLKLLVEKVEDAYVRENFQKIQEEADSNPFLKGDWVTRTYTFTGAVTGLLVPHGLSFLPKDVIITYQSGAGTCSINYGAITETQLSITTTGACVVRLLVGRFGA